MLKTNGLMVRLHVALITAMPIPKKQLIQLTFADPDAPTPAPESTPSKPTTATPQAATEDLF
jgi:hypothetical protein